MFWGVSGASDVLKYPKIKKGSYDYLDNSYPDNIGSYDYSYGYRYNNNHKVLMDIMYGYLNGYRILYNIYI